MRIPKIVTTTRSSIKVKPVEGFKCDFLFMGITVLKIILGFRDDNAFGSQRCGFGRLGEHRVAAGEHRAMPRRYPSVWDLCPNQAGRDSRCSLLSGA